MLATATILFVIGALVAGMNFYFCFLRYPIFRWRGGAESEYRHHSGIPVIGTIVLLCAAWLFFRVERQELFYASLIVTGFDTTGPQWFPVSIVWNACRQLTHRPP